MRNPLSLKLLGVSLGLTFLVLSCNSKPTAPTMSEDSFYRFNHEPTEFVTGHAEPRSLMGESEPPIPPWADAPELPSESVLE